MSASGAASAAPGRLPTQPEGARSERALWACLGLAITAVVAASASDGRASVLLVAVVAALVTIAYQRVLLAWQTMLGVILLVILFVPIRRYTVAGGLPIELEPYRIVIALVLGCWACALLVDPEVRWRRTGLELPIASVLMAIALSLIANLGRVEAAATTVVKSTTFFASYLLLVYFVSSVVRSRRHLDRILALLVGGGTIIGLTALVEWRTATNFFNWYGDVLPFLHYVDEGLPQARGSGVRARGSAQHPIALSAALVMLVPLALYLYRRHRRVAWLGCAGALTLGALSTGSRTGMVMLVAVLVTFFCIRPQQTLRLLPLVLVLAVVIQVVMPGTLGTMRSMLSPTYLVKEQSYDQGATAGRFADLGPALDRWSRKPLFGSGFGTTVADPTAPKDSERQILDDQWLGSLLEVGLVGVVALLWMFVRTVRRLAARARSAEEPDAWLATGLAASIVAFAVGMLTFDAFAFIQVTVLAFVILGLAAVLTRPRITGNTAR